jgi:hypothetical protein
MGKWIKGDSIMEKKINELAEGEEFLYCWRCYTLGRKIPANPYIGYVTYEGIRNIGSTLLFKGDVIVETLTKTSGRW